MVVYRLRKYRVYAGHTIYSLADKMKVNYSSISCWERGERHPRHPKIMQLQEIFGKDYMDLFTELTDEEIKEVESRERGLVVNPSEGDINADS